MSRMRLTSPNFGHDERIPARHSCEGKDVSPHLEWDRVPEETRSFALIAVDTDAEEGGFTHWVVFDIPADVRELPEGGADLGVAGRNDFQGEGWKGPCPPPNHPPHRYMFRLHALDVESLELDPGVHRDAVEEAIEGHVLAVAELPGRFERRPGALR